MTASSQPFISHNAWLIAFLCILVMFVIFYFSGFLTSLSPLEAAKTIPGNISKGQDTSREFYGSIPDPVAFHELVQHVIDRNPMGCTAYQADGLTHPPVEKMKELYTARIVFEDHEGAFLAIHEITVYNYDAFRPSINAVIADQQLALATNGTPEWMTDHDSYDTTLRCHDPNGEIYYLVFTRDDVELGGYSDNAIKTKFETWADTVPVVRGWKPN